MHRELTGYFFSFSLFLFLLHISRLAVYIYMGLGFIPFHFFFSALNTFDCSLSSHSLLYSLFFFTSFFCLVYITVIISTL
ncbi:hypothetical protein P167DRAFT_166128 [Morchella conica CCBAS932]|uniref:Uncharacterized protein n=1 Tax=Morchella conica CCBAS932 TaxID=1392247 RepID=A0A3N4KS73_9PEZI|nr:hypothetical protein P167DRAFT_166128 [Morchella conica CCBAS932]